MTPNESLQQDAKYIGKTLGITLKLDWLSGFCPVQAEGKFHVPNTHKWIYFFFRARGNQWRFSVRSEDQALFTGNAYKEKYSEEPFAAGMMPHNGALNFIKKSISLYISNPELYRPDWKA